MKGAAREEHFLSSEQTAGVLRALSSSSGRRFVRLRLRRAFPAGLARRVGLFAAEEAEGEGERRVVLAVGSDCASIEENEALLRDAPFRARASLVETLFVLKGFEGGYYVECMEYVKGPTLAELLRSGDQEAFDRALLNVLAVVKEVHGVLAPEGLGGKDWGGGSGNTFWSRYHEPRIARRVKDVGAHLPGVMRKLREEGYTLAWGGRTEVVPGLTATLGALRRRQVELEPDSTVMIHGDCKPENLIVQDGTSVMLDPHLAWGDSLVDYAKLYYWILTACKLSNLELEPRHAAELGQIEGLERRSGIVCRVELKNTPQARSFVRAAWKGQVWTAQRLARLHVSCGSVLTWQAGRLLEVASRVPQLPRQAEEQRDRLSDSFSVVHEQRRGLNETQPHVLLALLLGFFHLGRAAKILDGQAPEAGVEMPFAQLKAA